MSSSPPIRHAEDTVERPAIVRVPFALGVLCWLLVSAAFTAQFGLSEIITGHKPLWGKHFLNELGGWGSVLIFVPLIGALAQRFPLVGSYRIRHLLIHLGLSTCLTLVVGSLETTLLYHAGLFPTTLTLSRLLAIRTVGAVAAGWLIYGIVLMGHHAFSYYEAMRSRERRSEQLKALLTQAQLDVLKMQLQPHFLFNTLHAISGMMGQDVAGARQMMSRLSDLLRAAMETGTQEAPLAEELRLLERYLEIQQMRFNDRLVIILHIEPAALSMRVPRLFLQPLAENAIRHGLSQTMRGGHLDIIATVRGTWLRLEVRDDGVGLPPGQLIEGIGLSNTRARLRQLYGDAHRIEIRPRFDGGTSVLVEIPARVDEASDDVPGEPGNVEIVESTGAHE